MILLSQCQKKQGCQQEQEGSLAQATARTLAVAWIQVGPTTNPKVIFQKNSFKLTINLNINSLDTSGFWPRIHTPVLLNSSTRKTGHCPPPTAHRSFAAPLNISLCICVLCRALTKLLSILAGTSKAPCETMWSSRQSNSGLYGR